jgi:hypothetical protein
MVSLFSKGKRTSTTAAIPAEPSLQVLKQLSDFRAWLDFGQGLVKTELEIQ